MIKVISFDIGGTILINTGKDNYDLHSLANAVNLHYNLVRDAYKKIFQKNKGTIDELVENFCNILQINLIYQVII